MNDFALSLTRGYELAKKRNPNLSKGQYMAEVRPNTYANLASAERAYNKIVGGYTSGKRIQIEAEKRYGNPYKIRPGEKPRLYPPRPGSESGLWIAKITFKYDKIDPETGQNKKDDIRYILGTTYEYTSNVYRPYVRAIMTDFSLTYVKLLETGNAGTPPLDIDYVGEPIIEVYRTDVSRIKPDSPPAQGATIDLDNYVANNVIDEINFGDEDYEF